jgi:4-hydroxyphenylpyruvate dioxygenase
MSTTTTKSLQSKGGSSVVSDLGKGVSGNRPEDNHISIKYLDFDHLELTCGNPKQSAHFYSSLFGFQVEQCEDVYNQTGNVRYYLRNGGVRFMLSGSIDSGNLEIQKILNSRGDSVSQVGLRVNDISQVYNHLQSRGITFIKNTFESIQTISMNLFDNVKHTFVQRDTDNKTGNENAFWSGLSGKSTTIESLNKVNQFFEKNNCGIPEFIKIDHVGFPQPKNCSEKVIQKYYDDLGFYMFWSIDEKAISSKQSSLKSTVVSDYDNQVRFPIFEPVEKEKKSQIQEFLDYNDGAGAQHIAIEINDILTTVKAMRERGVEFLSVSESYYEIVEQKLKEYNIEIKENMEEIKENHILLDFDIEGNYLLQIFTKPLTDRPTMFLEFIQRSGHEGFGEGNFNRLFLSIEKEQEKRGNLV